MMQGIGCLQGFNTFDRRVFSNKNSSHVVIALGALALGTAIGCWTLSSRPAPAPKLSAAASKPANAQKLAARNPYGPMLVGLGRPERAALATPAPAEPAPAQQMAAIAAPPAAEAGVVATVTQQAPDEAAPSSTPLPPKRPAELGALASRSLYQPQLRRLARLENTTAVPAAPADERSIFEKFFGVGQSTAQQQQQPAPAARRAPGQALAYAAPETTGLGSVLSDATRSAVAPTAPAAPPAGGYDRYTAIYDISAHTVYLPNGQKLEAHSGLREHLDDPRFVHVRMKGPTPPNVYALSPREALFHGVEALRLTPIGGGTFGRAGLLAHTYMLGPNGDSNGCVSFRDYGAFLQAYKSGQVRRLVVVAHM